jgi:hypothetical protein
MDWLYLARGRDQWFSVIYPIIYPLRINPKLRELLCLFNNAVSNSDLIALSNRKMNN